MKNQPSFRPHCHLTPETGWINDPNGLVYFRDKWHCFYQFFDPEQVDGMQWGHAVSKDLLHWEHLPAAISPDQHGQIWSGSAVVDEHNCTGFFSGGSGMVCFFTYWDKLDHGQCQGLAYSHDGCDFKVLDEPIIPRLDGEPVNVAFRDPKVFWYEPGQHWVMAVAGGKLRIYNSVNLIDWNLCTVHDDLITECPDLFPLRIKTEPEKEYWILSGGGRWYHLGDFNGKRFSPIGEALVMGAGPDWYATQTWSDAPDGRRIGISWLYGWSYETALDADGVKHMLPTDWAGGCLSLPYEITLERGAGGPELRQRPIAELSMLRRSCNEVATQLEAGESLSLPELNDSALEISFRTRLPASWYLSIAGDAGTSLRCGIRERELYLERQGNGDLPESFTCERAVLLADGDHVDIQIIIDRVCIEIIAGDGAHILSAIILPDPEKHMVLTAETGISEFSLTRLLTCR